MSSGWEKYIEQLLHKYDFPTDTIKTQNVCSAAAIYGKDGNCWMYSREFPELKNYDFVVEGMCESEN